MECPNCGLENPDTAILCDCGYDFIEKPEVKTEKHIPWWLQIILVLLAFLAIIIGKFLAILLL